MEGSVSAAVAELVKMPQRASAVAAIFHVNIAGMSMRLRVGSRMRMGSCWGMHFHIGCDEPKNPDANEDGPKDQEQGKPGKVHVIEVSNEK